MIAVDTSVLIDLLGDDARADAAEACLRLALSSGPVVVCDVVVSEVTAGLGHGSEVMDVLEEMGLRFLALDQRAAIRAGEMQRKYKQRALAGPSSAASQRTIPDFLVGAHAMLQCDALLTRDEGFFRDYFKGLKVITPTLP
ncbi:MULTISPECIES: type II toxin-antitoxin system VapC family toxin [Roseateles]|uniref:Type II toxin-antitoxin system VapC family toxin n=1 Tax=Roseateles albus TaxID=2987525 RepID=A0ABT5KJV4_9BURK|nr:MULTISPECIES: type II toxin-antitoxin system VapC family toxin [Roseateles]MCV2357273.1 type II toxin-antitoxin system VapC family toxin [Paucibacter sp. B2R-40]MCV2360855.1 type II toxin-antitoxin system VapC family toxin [Paucibacter sp. TC2R-5]MDC8773220.1 type II toxin-antitoxin system VapC family toxin [Roseateles albus]